MMVEAVLLQAQQFEVMEALSRVGKLRFGFMLILLRCLGLHIFATTHGLRSTLVPLLSFEIGVRPCCVSFMGLFMAVLASLSWPVGGKDTSLPPSSPSPDGHSGQFGRGPTDIFFNSTECERTSRKFVLINSSVAGQQRTLGKIISEADGQSRKNCIFAHAGIASCGHK